VARETGNLKNKQVEKLIRAGEPGKHYDGRGLRLEIKGPSSASWVTRYQIDGVTRYMGLGSAFDFTLGALSVSEIDVPLVLKVLEQPVQAALGYPAGPLCRRGARPPTGLEAGLRQCWTGPRRAATAVVTTRPRGR
jgi:hypothetical protein